MARITVALLFWVYASVAVAEGDAEYGEYLSSGCVSCHQAKAHEGGIPVIHGMDAAGFVDIMKLYRDRNLDNPTMQTIAGSLTDEDIAALAAYFSSQPIQE